MLEIIADIKGEAWLDQFVEAHRGKHLLVKADSMDDFPVFVRHYNEKLGGGAVSFHLIEKVMDLQDWMKDMWLICLPGNVVAPWFKARLEERNIGIVKLSHPEIDGYRVKITRR